MSGLSDADLALRLCREVSHHDAWIQILADGAGIAGQGVLDAAKDARRGLGRYLSALTALYSVIQARDGEQRAAEVLVEGK